MLSLEQDGRGDGLGWIRQRRDEIDVLAASLGALAVDMEGDARDRAHRAVAQLHAIRSVFAQRLDGVNTVTASARHLIEKTATELGHEWQGVEFAFEAFIAAAADRPDVLRAAQTARARARTQSWEIALDHVRTSSTAAVEQARRDLDAIMRHIAAEQVKLQTFSVGSDQAWKTLKCRLDDVQAVYDRTWTQILDGLRHPC